MDKFWRWVQNSADDPDNPGIETGDRILFLEGTIAAESWFDDELTPAKFKSELNAGKGNITVWINSPGGDCFAAAQIYNMLRDYMGKVTVKIDGLAASAASVIMMAGDEVLVSPVSTVMIHNPSTIAFGDHVEMEKAIAMLEEVKNSIINAYQEKTHLSRNKLSKLMEDETWMNAQKAIDLGFADGMIQRGNGELASSGALMFSTKSYTEAITNKLNERFHVENNGCVEKEDTENTSLETSEITTQEEVDTGSGVTQDIPEDAESVEETEDTVSADAEETKDDGHVDTALLYDRLRGLKDLF